MDPAPPQDPKPPVTAPATYTVVQRFPEKDLDQLGLFFRIGGGITSVFSLCALPHTIMGIVFTTNPDAWGKNPPPPGFGWIFLLMGGMFFGGYLTLGIATLYGAKMIEERRGRTALQVISGFNCLHMPIGMALGIYALILLNRDDIRALFKD